MKGKQMNAVICKDRTQMESIRNLGLVSSCMLLCPELKLFRILTFRKAIIMPGVDVNQDVEGMKLRTLIEQRQKTFLDAEIIFL